MKAKRDPDRKLPKPQIKPAPKVVLPPRGSVSLLGPMPTQDATRTAETPAREIMRCPRCKSPLETKLISRVPIRRETECTNPKCKFKSKGITVATADARGDSAARGTSGHTTGRSTSDVFSGGRAFFMISVTDKGSATASANVLTIPNVAMSQGSSIIVSVVWASTNTIGQSGSVTWNGLSLARDRSMDPDFSTAGENVGLSVFSRNDLTAGTGSVVITGPVDTFQILATVAQATQLSSPALDVAGDAAGADPDQPSSGSTGGISQSEELVFGLVGAVYSDGAGITIGGTWSGGLTGLHDVSEATNRLALTTGYRQVLSTAPPFTEGYTAAKTGVNLDPAFDGVPTWGAICVTYKKE